MGTHFEGTDEQRRSLSVYIKLMRAAESTTSRINDHLRDYGLTVSQFGVLEALYHLGPMCQGDLARKILKSSGNLTTVVDNLARDELVERVRSDTDRRMVHVHLTDKGRALIEQILPPHVANVVAAFSVLTVEEQEMLDGLLRKVGKNVVRSA
ncbi:MAG: MarR family transcriptional regulator [Caldilineaceae bacterium]|nr:MarR family transcriptional regulator [Caldilineaceae bacterium]